MNKQDGFVLPFVLAFGLIAAAAIAPQWHQPENIESDHFRHQQATWFHWQQAAVAFYKANQTWPSSLTQLAVNLGLPAAPNYLYGRRVGYSFRLQLNQLSAEQVTSIQSVLGAEITRATASSVEVTLTNPSDDSTSQTSQFKRIESAAATPALVDIDLQNNRLNGVHSLNSHKLILRQEMTYPNNEVFYVQAENLSAPEGITIKRFSSTNVPERGLGALIRDAKALLVDLYAHYASAG